MWLSSFNWSVLFSHLAHFYIADFMYSRVHAYLVFLLWLFFLFFKVPNWDKFHRVFNWLCLEIVIVASSSSSSRSNIINILWPCLPWSWPLSLRLNQGYKYVNVPESIIAYSCMYPSQISHIVVCTRVKYRI